MNIQFPPSIQWFLERGYMLRMYLKNGDLIFDLENAQNYESEDGLTLLKMTAKSVFELRKLESKANSVQCYANETTLRFISNEN